MCHARPPARGDYWRSPDTTSARACPRPLPWSRRDRRRRVLRGADPALGAPTSSTGSRCETTIFSRGFAAAKYTKHGPGALFVFGNSVGAHVAERATAIVRGGDVVRATGGVGVGGITEGRGRLRLEDFTKRCSRWTPRRWWRTGATGPRSRRAVRGLSTPRMTCGGAEAAAVEEEGRGGKGKGGKGKGEYPGEGGCAVLSVQYGDFRAKHDGANDGAEDALVVSSTGGGLTDRSLFTSNPLTLRCVHGARARLRSISDGQCQRCAALLGGNNT